MNTLLDELLVGVLLLISTGYVFSTLGPRILRRRVLATLSAWLARTPALPGMRRTAQRIADAAEAKPQGSCGGCDNCAAEAPVDRAAASGVGSEINVPMANIGRVRR